MSLVWAFIRRDLQVQLQYRLGPVLVVGHALSTMLPFFFLAKLVDPSTPAALAPYGQSYFAFVLVGVACTRLLTLSVAFSGMIREEQLQGTLEALLTAPQRALTMVFGSALWYFLWALIEVFLYIGLGVWLFKIPMSQLNLGAGVVVLLLTMTALSSVGVFSVCGVLLFKRVDPVGWGIGMLSGLMQLLSGVYFPVDLLPAPLQSIAQLLPLTYALEGFRQALLNGKSLQELTGVCVVLGACALILWPMALFAMRWTITRLKVTGAVHFQ